MLVWQCDSCHKELDQNNKVTVEMRMPMYHKTIHLCEACASDIVGILKIKEVI